MAFLPAFKKLFNSSNKNQSLVLPRDKLFSLIENEPHDEGKVLDLIQKEDILNAISVDELNYVTISEKKINVLCYCILTHQFKVATELLKKEGVKIDLEIEGRTALNEVVHFLFLKDETKVFFDELFSKKRTYDGNIYGFIDYVFLDAPNGEFVSNFINTFDIKLNNKTFFGEDFLEYLQEREEAPLYTIKAILNSNQFSQERLEQIIHSPKKAYETEEFRLAIEEKLIEYIKESKDKLDELLVDSKIKNKIQLKPKQKI